MSCVKITDNSYWAPLHCLPNLRLTAVISNGGLIEIFLIIVSDANKSDVKHMLRISGQNITNNSENSLALLGSSH